MSADFDKAIDGAVREMLDVEPRADLRDRVVASAFSRNRATVPSGLRRTVSSNLGRTVSSGSLLTLVASGFSRNRVLALGAAAAILLAVIVVRQSEPVAPQAPVVARTTDQYLPGEAASAAPQIAVAAPDTARPPSRPAQHTVATGRAVAAAALPDSASTHIEPLTAITPIAIAPIEQDGIAPADVAVRPLNTLHELQIAPLTPPDRR